MFRKFWAVLLFATLLFTALTVVATPVHRQRNPVPGITGLSPSSATAGATAQALTINGTNFLSTSTVTYNAAAHTATYVSATQLKIQLSASDQSTAGSYPVVVTNPGPGGGPSNSVNFTVTAANNPVPSISSLSPASATAGAAARTLTINGTNFLSTSTVTYNAVAHAATYVSAAQLTIQLSTSDQGTAGSYPVVVTNPGPGGGVSNSVNFTVTTANNPVPSIGSLSPSSAIAGAAAQTLTINGTNFLSTSTVTYNAAPHAATFVSAAQLTIQLSTSDQATAGSYPVVVTNPGPGGGASNSVNFTVATANNPVPSISSLSPSSATAGAAAQNLTINGTNFLSTSTVTYNAAAHTATYVSASQLKIQLSMSDQATAGSYPVVVTNPGPGGGASNSVTFTVTTANNPVPSIGSLSPSSAIAGAAAQTLTINGTNFLSTSTVTYNAVAHAATYVSATQLTIQLSTSDQGTAGSYPVVVTNPGPGGGASNSINFTVTAANNPVPSIGSLSPSSATAGAAAQTLTINGTNFLSTSTVTYNAAPHTATYVSATQLTIQLSTSDQATAGNYPVVVTNPGPGGGVSNSVNFTVNPATGAQVAQFTNPVDGATGVDPAVNFTWTNVLNAQVYKIYLSTIQAGGTDAWQSAELPNITSLSEMNVIPNTLFYYSYQTFTPPVLEANTLYYARMWTNVANTWYYVDSTFTTGYGTAKLTNPTDAKGGLASSFTFTWNAVADAAPTTPYYLYVGTQPGQLSGGVCTVANACVWQTGPTSATSATIPAGILQANTAYYASLWTQKNGQSFHSDTSFSTGSFTGTATLSQLVYPYNGATNVDPFAPIRWTTVPVAKATGYFLYVGDGTSGNSQEDYVYYPTSATAWEGGLVGGKTYYVTLWTLAATSSCPSGCWTAAKFSFTTAPVATPPNESAFYETIVTATATLRNMAAGNTDATFVDTFLRNNQSPSDVNYVAFCADFANNLMVQLTKQGIVAHRRDTVFGGGPEAHSIVEYWDPFLLKWAVTDATFGMMFYDSTKSPATMGMSEIATALAQGTETTIPNTFVTTASVTASCPTCFGSYWDLNYYLDPILHYLNPLTISELQLELSTANNPTPFMLSQADPVGVAATYVFSFTNSTDSVLINNGGSQIKVVPQPSTAPIGNPVNFGNFSGPTTLSTGWSYSGTPPSGLAVKRLECPMYQGPTCP